MQQSPTRIQVIFDALNTNPNAFALAHGFNVPTLYGFSEGKTNPGYNTLVNICAAEPRISAEFLIRGEGSPLRSERQTADLTTADELRAFKEEMNQALDKRIAELDTSVESR